MVGLIGERTHVRNAYVEQMPRIDGGVGETAADLLGRLDHHDFGRTLAENAREMQPSKCSSGAATDDRNSHYVRPPRNLPTTATHLRDERNT